jgi:hypothetical protein
MMFSQNLTAASNIKGGFKMRCIKSKYYFTKIIISLLICLLPISAHGVLIEWDQWKVTGPTVTGQGSASWQPAFLKANAGFDLNPYNPSTYFNENAQTHIAISSFFTVKGRPTEQGKQVDAYLTGSLSGLLSAIGISLGDLTGSYNSSISANVNATFANWSSNPSDSGGVLLFDIPNKVIYTPFLVPGRLTVGERYPFQMSLTVDVSKNGAYSVESIVYGFSAIVAVGVVPSPAPPAAPPAAPQNFR